MLSPSAAARVRSGAGVRFFAAAVILLPRSRARPPKTVVLARAATRPAVCAPPAVPCLS